MPTTPETKMCQRNVWGPPCHQVDRTTQGRVTDTKFKLGGSTYVNALLRTNRQQNIQKYFTTIYRNIAVQKQLQDKSTDYEKLAKYCEININVKTLIKY